MENDCTIKSKPHLNPTKLWKLANAIVANIKYKKKGHEFQS